MYRKEQSTVLKQLEIFIIEPMLPRHFQGLAVRRASIDILPLLLDQLPFKIQKLWLLDKKEKIQLALS